MRPDEQANKILRRNEPPSNVVYWCAPISPLPYSQVMSEKVDSSHTKTSLCGDIHLLETEEFHVEDERRAAGYGAGRSILTVRPIATDVQVGPLAHLHRRYTLIPTFNDTTRTLELEWLVAVARRIELLAVDERASVMNFYIRALGWRRAGALSINHNRKQ